MRKLIKELSHPTRNTWRLRPWAQHSQVLVVSGAVYWAVGVSYVLTEPTDARHAALVLAKVIMPIQAWGALWLVAGALVFISARWPPVSETWGYSVLTALSSAWSFAYFAGILLGAPPSAISGALLWGLVAYLWYAISGLANPLVIVATTHETPEVTGE